MAYSEQLRKRAVALLSEHGPEKAREMIRTEYGVKVSRKSLYNWADDPEYRPEGAKVSVFQQGTIVNNVQTNVQHINVTPPKPTAFNQQHFIDAFGAMFGDSAEVITSLMKEVAAGLNPENNKKLRDQIRKMSPGAKAALYSKLVKIQTTQFEFILDAQLKTGGGDSLQNAIDAMRDMMAGIPGGEVVETVGGQE